MFRYLYLIWLIIFVACSQDKIPKPAEKIKTENVIVVIIDGPRYSETFGDSTFQNIPKQHQLIENCAFLENFSNSGNTFTVPGHAAILAGFYENLANNGSEYPVNQTIMNYWLNATDYTANDASLICSKDKLQVLAGNNPNEKKPFLDCGISGLGSGYRYDSITHNHVMQKLSSSQQRMMIINYLGPDSKGHQANWTEYIAAIKETDLYVFEIWNLIQSNPNYKDKTTLIVTNDHGRHPNNIADGFVSHGDGCEGCRKIQCQVYSPDVINERVTTAYNQTNIAATVAYLLKIPAFYEGKNITPMWDILKKFE
jgi:alkaline phosphatase